MRERLASSARRRRNGQTRGFTLVELLVVIGIIAVLLGILLPVISGGRRQARMVEELAAARQLMAGYLLYTQANHGALIPGRIVAELYPGMMVTDDMGVSFEEKETANRWPWRLIAPLGYPLRGMILVNEQAAQFESRNQPKWAYFISLYPSFGMNLFNVGGDLEMPLLNHDGYLTKITQSRHSSRLIVFASARASGNMLGNYFVRPPKYRMGTWDSPASWPDTPYSESDRTVDWGYIHPRWKGRAIVGCLDGHAEALTVDELRDMTRWSEQAAQAGDPNWMP